MGVAFDFDLADLGDLADQLKITVNIDRVDPLTSELVPERPYTAIEMIIMPREAPQTILPTGEVITNPAFTAYLFEQLDICVGDIVQRTDKPKLFVESIFAPDGTNIMTLGLEEERL